MAEDASSLDPVILTVFWCGTGASKEYAATQIELFYCWCRGTDLTRHVGPITADTQDDTEEPRDHYKLIFDGCGVAYGTSGMLWGTGLSEQASLLRDYIDQLRTIYGQERKVVVNLFGLSRGGVACFILARKLSGYSVVNLDVNMLAYDPVPGNFVATARLDFFRVTNAWANMDLRKCEVVKTALVLYTHEPLPTMAVHAPMIPLFHRNTHVIYDVILGCHQGAMWNHVNIAEHTKNLDTWFSAFLVRNFLASHGTLLHTKFVDAAFSVDETELLARLDEENEKNSKSKRCTHSYGALEVKRTPGRQWLNQAHYLMHKMRQDDVPVKHWKSQPYLYAYAPPPPQRDSVCTLHFSSELSQTGGPE